MRGAHLQEVPTIVISLRKFWYFGKVVADEGWSLTRGAHTGKFDCTNPGEHSKNSQSLHTVEFDAPPPPPPTPPKKFPVHNKFSLLSN